MSTDGNPEDVALLAQLESAAEEQFEAWARLLAVAEGFAARPHAQDDVRWQAPKVQDDQVVQVGFPVYGARVRRAHEALAQVGAITPAYHWMQQAPLTLPTDGSPLPPADAVRIATATFRGERFGDGTIGTALEKGTLQAVLASLATWYRRRT